MDFNKREYLAYRVGGLLYTPALKKDIDKKIINDEINKLMSISFCLEDSIADNAINDAEVNLKLMLKNIRSARKKDLPLIFIRIRSPEHMEHIHTLLAEAENIVTGYILPKFDFSNAEKYLKLAEKINKNSERRIYLMPILESGMVAELGTRASVLIKLKEITDQYKKYILNIRVGGNDFSNLYGLRRNEHQNIYEIGVIRDILANIINVFADTYVVSGPVWEYFKKGSDTAWEKGLRKEIELDLLNGFIGKTCIHPSQLPVFYDCMRVRRSDLEDAEKILKWDVGSFSVAKSYAGNRMNEYKTHKKWAEKICILRSIYGIKDE